MKPKDQTDAQEADTQLDLVISQELGRENGTAATREHQPERAQKFRAELGDQRPVRHYFSSGSFASRPPILEVALGVTESATPRRHQRPNSGPSDPPVTHEAETVVIFSRRLSPLVWFDRWKRDISCGRQIDFSDFQGLQSVPRRAIDLTAAGDEDRGRSKITGQGQSLVQEGHGAHIVPPPCLVPGDDEGGTAWQRPADRVVGLATHDQHLSRCEVSKPAPVLRNAPRDVLTITDHSVPGNRRNPDDHRLS